MAAQGNPFQRITLTMREVLCDSIERGERPPVVYGLVDPMLPDVVRYVGRTKDPETRFRAHYFQGAAWVREWMESVVAAGRKPTMVLLERCTDDRHGREREAYWTHLFLGFGHADLNVCIPRLLAGA